MLTVANVLDFVVAVITFQYPHIDVIMWWYTLCVYMHASLSYMGPEFHNRGMFTSCFSNICYDEICHV